MQYHTLSHTASLFSYVTHCHTVMYNFLFAHWHTLSEPSYKKFLLVIDWEVIWTWLGSQVLCSPREVPHYRTPWKYCCQALNLAESGSIVVCYFVNFVHLFACFSSPYLWKWPPWKLSDLEAALDHWLDSRLTCQHIIIWPSYCHHDIIISWPYYHHRVMHSFIGRL